MNKVILCGNLGSDPEVRNTTNSTVCNFSVATSERKKVNGNWESVTSWHRITCWGKTAENCGKYLKKGNKVLIDGKLEYGQYEKHGRTVYTTDIVAFSVEFLSAPNSSGEPQAAPAPQIPQVSMGDDVPF